MKNIVEGVGNGQFLESELRQLDGFTKLNVFNDMFRDSRDDLSDHVTEEVRAINEKE